MKRSVLLATVLVASFFSVTCSNSPAASQPQQSHISSTVPCTSPSQSLQVSADESQQQFPPQAEYNPGSEVAVVTASVGNVREEAALGSPVVLQVAKNDLLFLNGEDQDGPWYHIIVARTGQKGWVHNDVIRRFTDDALLARDDVPPQSEIEEFVERDQTKTSAAPKTYSPATSLPLPIPKNDQANTYSAPEDSSPRFNPPLPQSSSPLDTYSTRSYSRSYPSAPSTSSAGSYGPGEVSVRGYTRRDGTYVAPHVRTAPNSSKLDNWSTRGNTNPRTGKRGSKSPF